MINLQISKAGYYWFLFYYHIFTLPYTAKRYWLRYQSTPNDPLGLTQPPASAYANSGGKSMPEAVSENLTRRPTSNARGGTGNDFSAERHGYESGVVQKVGEAVVIDAESIKQAKLKEKVIKYIKKLFRRDKPEDIEARTEEYVKAVEEEWSQEALEDLLGKSNVTGDEKKIRRDMLRLTYEMAKKDGVSLEKYLSRQRVEELNDILWKEQGAARFAEMQNEQGAVLIQEDKKATILPQQKETKLHQNRIPEAERLQRFTDAVDSIRANMITDERLLNAIESYRELITQEQAGIKVSGDDLKRMVQLLEDRMNSQPAIDPASIQAQEVRHLQARLRNLASALNIDENEGAYRGRLERIIIKDVVDDETGDRMKLKKIVWNQRARNKVFNDLYSIVDSKPHEFWERAFNPLTQGARDEDFMSFVQEAFSGTRAKLEEEHGADIIDSYASLRRGELTAKYHDAGTLANFEATGNLNDQNERNLIFDELRKELNKDHFLYQKERQARETLHNANAILYRTDIQPEQLFNFIKQFGSELGDLAHRFQGVRNMMDIYEEQVRLAMLRHNGYLRAEDVLGITTAETRVERGQKVTVQLFSKKSRIEEEAKRIFKDRYSRGMIYIHTKDGGTVDMRSELDGAEIQPWELERIMTIGRGMMIASQRMLSLAAESRLTGEAQINQLFLQDILYAYSYFIHLNAKYHVPGKKPTGALIFEPGIEKWGPGFDLWLKPHRLKPAYEAHEQWKEHPVEFMESHDLADLQRQNPNRAGDLFTWLSDWRVKEDVRGNETIIRDFMARGERKMIDVIRVANPMSNDYAALRQAADFLPMPDGVTTDEFYVQHAGVVYENLDEPNATPSEHDRAAINLYTYLHGGDGINDANRAQILELGGRLNEYVKWIGTGLRFERMRSKLTYLDYFKDKKNQPIARATVPKAMELLSHIVDFQPDKIFLKSRKIQARVMPQLREFWQNPDRTYIDADGVPRHATENGIFSEERFQEALQKTMSDLNYMQDTVYKNRERLIEQERSFDEMRILDRNGNILYDLDLIYNPNPGPGGQQLLDIAPPNPNDEYYQGQEGQIRLQQDQDKYEAVRQQREDMRTHIEQQLQDQNSPLRKFIELMQEDWDTHHGGMEETKRHDGAKEDNTPSYFEEFIKYREYYHGFVLWSGDAPLDEFRMTSIGPTGAFTMRAGNSIDNYKAAQAGNDLLGNLKNIQTPEQAIPFLGNIYKPIFNYDLNRAQEVMGEWAETLLKVYGADWQYVIPLWGGFRGYIGKSSFVQSWYGKRMAIWQAQEKRHLIDLMREKGYLSDAKYNELKVLARARWWWEIPVDKLNYPLQLLLLAGTIYVLQKGLSDDDR